MGSLTLEVKNIQNPALGAFLIWNFSRGYYSNSSKEIPFQLLFIILPMLYTPEIVKEIISTRKGLYYCIDKFKNSKLPMNDVILSIHSASSEMKNLTLDSIRIGVNCNLFTLLYETASIKPICNTEHSVEYNRIDKLQKAAVSLGKWCSELTLHEIARTLKVRF